MSNHGISNLVRSNTTSGTRAKRESKAASSAVSLSASAQDITKSGLTRSNSKTGLTDFTAGGRLGSNATISKSASNSGSTTSIGAKPWTSLEDSKGLHSYLKDKKKLLVMVNEEMYASSHSLTVTRLLQKMLLKKSPTDADLLNALHNDLNKRDFTISSHTNLILLDALVNSGKFDEYFVNVNALAKVAGLSFARIVLGHAETYAPGKLEQYVNGVYKKATQKIITAVQAGKELELPPGGNPSADSANPVLSEALLSSIRLYVSLII